MEKGFQEIDLWETEKQEIKKESDRGMQPGPVIAKEESGRKENPEPMPEEYITELRKTRKAFLIEYSCSAVLLGFLAISYLIGNPPGKNITLFVVLLGALFLVSAEVGRVFTRYTITSKKITVVKGIIKQNKKDVHFIPLGYIPEINLKQNYLQRILGYGTVFIHGSAQNSFEIKDVDNPQLVLQIIEELIEKSRKRL